MNHSHTNSCSLFTACPYRQIHGTGVTAHNFSSKEQHCWAWKGDCPENWEIRSLHPRVLAARELTSPCLHQDFLRFSDLKFILLALFHASFASTNPFSFQEILVNTSRQTILSPTDIHIHQDIPRMRWIGKYLVDSDVIGLSWGNTSWNPIRNTTGLWNHFVVMWMTCIDCSLQIPFLHL